MGFGIVAVMKPVLDEFQVVANAAAIDSDPVDAFNPFTLKSVALQGFTAQAEGGGGLLLVDELNHWRMSGRGN